MMHSLVYQVNSGDFFTIFQDNIIFQDINENSHFQHFIYLASKRHLISVTTNTTNSNEYSHCTLAHTVITNMSNYIKLYGNHKVLQPFVAEEGS